MGSKLDHDSAFFILKEDPSISTCLILLTNTQTNGHENITSFVEIINVCTNKIQVFHYILVNEKARKSIHACFYMHLFNN